MWVQFGSVEPMYLLLGSALIVLSQHVTAIVPTKRQKVAPKNPVKTLDDLSSLNLKRNFVLQKSHTSLLRQTFSSMFLISM